MLFSGTSRPLHEASEVCSVESFADRHGHSRSALAHGAVRDINNVCDMVTLRRLFAHSKRGKACGIDGVRNDYCAIAPVEMAEVFHPILTKCALRVQEPLAHKCGITVDLWKGKGDHSLMKSYPVAPKAYFLEMGFSPIF